MNIWQSEERLKNGETVRYNKRFRPCLDFRRNKPVSQLIEESVVCEAYKNEVGQFVVCSWQSKELFIFDRSADALRFVELMVLGKETQ